MTRNRLNTVLALLAAATLIVATTLAEGLRDGRWAATGVPGTLATLQIPAAIGDWERDEGPTALGGPLQGVEWTYRRQHPERTARVCLFAGSRRALQVHSPQACYPAVSLRSQGEPASLPLPADSIRADAWRACFWREEPAGRRPLIAVWTTRAGGSWTTADAGAAAGRLARVYLFAEEPVSPPAKDQRLADFAGALLPELEESLAPLLDHGLTND